jgi:hypothetical protein
MRINKGRMSAAAGADGKVLFLIGMRINSLWRVWKWLPVFVAMPRMLIELQKNRDLGLVGKPRTMLSGRVIMVWQYWESFDKLQAYSRGSNFAHLPAWREFNKKVRDNGTVGIFHETVVLSDPAVETVYGNMPPIGLGAVLGLVPASTRGQTAAVRLKHDDPSGPPVEPY